LNKIHVNCKFILIGPEENYIEVEKIYRNFSSNVTNLCGHFSIEELATLFTMATGYFGNDGGMSQLAGTMGCPSVVIFNSVEEDWITHPWRSEKGVVRNRTECSPCFNAINCPLGHRKCVTDIPLEDVLKKADEIIFKHNS
jgi:ADP-heptose:LPS heptosyltransferase